MSNYQVIFQDDSESLSHFGIKGMRWGVRRYQNPDGTRTPEGKARYSESGNGSIKDRKKEALSDPRKLAENLKDPDMKFTQEEIDGAIRTFNKENNILRLAKERNDLTNFEKQKKGEKIVKNLLSNYGQELGRQAAKYAAIGTLAIAAYYGANRYKKITGKDVMDLPWMDIAKSMLNKKKK